MITFLSINRIYRFNTCLKSLFFITEVDVINDVFVQLTELGVSGAPTTSMICSLASVLMSSAVGQL